MTTSRSAFLTVLTMLVVAACTEAAAPPRWAHVGPVGVEIMAIRIVDERTLEVSSTMCGQLDVEVGEELDRVVVAASNVLAADEDWDEDPGCPEGSIPAIVTLADDLDGRAVTIDAPDGPVGLGFPIAQPCLYGPGDRWCRELTIDRGGQLTTVGTPELTTAEVDLRLAGDAAVDGGADAADGGPTARSIEFSDGLVLSVRSWKRFEYPTVYEHRMIADTNRKMWGGVAVHNVRRPLDGAERVDRDVAGFPAYWVTPAGFPAEPADIVVVDTGSWSIDVSLWTRDAATRRGVVDSFLDDLEIELRPGHVPAVRSASGALAGVSWVEVSHDGSYGFGFTPSPVCDPMTEPGCQRGHGFVNPLVDPLEPRLDGVANLQPVPGSEERDPAVALPSELAVTVVEPGLGGELVSCSGGPSFDPGLLPSGPDRGLVHRDVEVYTGIRTWRWRTRPGIMTLFVGSPDEPRAVATYEQQPDGTWAATSVTACS